MHSVFVLPTGNFAAGCFSERASAETKVLQADGSRFYVVRPRKRFAQDWSNFVVQPYIIISLHKTLASASIPTRLMFKGLGILQSIMSRTEGGSFGVALSPMPGSDRVEYFEFI